MAERIGVLFLQARERFGADAAVHESILRELDRDRFRPFLACAPGTKAAPSQALLRFRDVPDLQIIETEFAPSLGDGGGAKSFGRVLVGAAQLAQRVRREGIRVVHSCERPREVLYNLALGRLCQTKSVLHVHIKWAAGYDRLPRYGVSHADGVVSISDFVTKSVYAQGRKGPVFTVHNGIDPAPFLARYSVADVRAQLGIASNAEVILSVARLFEGKGQRELIRAFERVAEERPRAHLVIVGEDAPHLQGKSFRAELESLASTLALTERITFTGQRSDIPELMAACDVFALPSFEEPFGLVYLEAMASAKPVVSLTDGGTPEVVVHGETGLLSPPWDVPRLAEHLTQLLADEACAKRMGNAGRERVLSLFTASAMTERIASVYEQLAAPAHPRSNRR